MTLLAQPFVEVDVVQAVRRYRRLSSLLPRAAVHYAVQNDRDPGLLAALARAGCKFYVSAPTDVGSCLAAGAAPEDLVYSAVGQGRDDLAEAADGGVHLFVVSSPEDVCHLALAAPGSAVLYRGLSPGRASDRSSEPAVVALRQAAASGLEAAGLSWRVSARRQDPRAWRAPIADSARIFSALRAEGLRPWVLDLGGLPAAGDDRTPPLALHAASIDRTLREEFGVARPRTLVTTARALLG